MNEERIQQEVKAAEALFKEMSMTARVDKFWASEEAQTILHSAYEVFRKESARYLEIAPEEVKSVGETFRNGATEEIFISDASVNFKRRLAASARLLKELLEVEWTQLGEVISTEGMLKELEDVGKNMSNTLINLFMETMYKNYVPQDIPPELVQLVRMLGGKNAVIIPGVAIFGEDSEM